MEEANLEHDFVIALLGEEGQGKSTLGHALTDNVAFRSARGSAPKTTEITKGICTATGQEEKTFIVEIPGLNTNEFDKLIKPALANLGRLSKQPIAMLLLIVDWNSRGGDWAKTIQQVDAHVGPTALGHVAVVFTHVDSDRDLIKCREFKSTPRCEKLLSAVKTPETLHFDKGGDLEGFKQKVFNLAQNGLQNPYQSAGIDQARNFIQQCSGRVDTLPEPYKALGKAKLHQFEYGARDM